tara:strand:+ start:48 stop:434 length:387 start_codon:yes stop_codon:yes gene_type:complete
MDDSKMNKFLKKGDIKFSKSKDQIWEEVFSKKMTSNKQESKIFSLHSFFSQKRFSYAVAATVLVLIGFAYFNYEDNSLASEEAEVIYKISKEEFAEIESSTIFESLFIEDQEVDYFFNMHVANQIVDE